MSINNKFKSSVIASPRKEYIRNLCESGRINILFRSLSSSGGSNVKSLQTLLLIHRSVNNTPSQAKNQRHLDSLVVECWLRVREVPGSIPSQRPRHIKDVIKMVPGSSLV